MAIEKMALLKIVGSLQEMESIIKELILYENVSIDIESDPYVNNYLIHQYETEIVGSTEYRIQDYDELDIECKEALLTVEDISKDLGIRLNLEKDLIKNNMGYEEAIEMLNQYKSTNGKIADEIKNKKEIIKELQYYKLRMDGIFDDTVEFDKIADLNFFDYEVGTLLNENRIKLKKNYESLTAVVIRIGIIKSTVENLYLIIYPKQYKEETTNFLKSLSWKQFLLPEKYTGTPAQISEQINSEIRNLEIEVKELSEALSGKNNQADDLMMKIYNTLRLQEKLFEIAKKADFGDNIFLLDVWVKECDVNNLKEVITEISDNIIVTDEKPNENAKPPTILKNNWLFRPFELIVKMYGLPSYNELDPTPFMALTYCLAFGIMFGDIGQGLVYFLAGLLIKKKLDLAGQLLMRLGGSSIIFGFVYGSLFGLEKHQLPWLPSLFEGGPLSSENIPVILVIGIAFGIIALSGSFIYGIINKLKTGDKEEGLFGKNGISGYLFFLSFIITILTIIGLIKIPLYVSILLTIFFLTLIMLKEPLANAMDKKELFPNGAGAYFTESIFESIETILSTLSNTVSFVRVGAFALNHAGLFLAFMVISELMDNILLKILILALGNILILVLEGLIVFIQGLRLQFYEMFNRYFIGEGIEFKSVKLN